VGGKYRDFAAAETPVQGSLPSRLRCNGRLRARPIILGAVADRRFGRFGGWPDPHSKRIGCGGGRGETKWAVVENRAMASPVIGRSVARRRHAGLQFCAARCGDSGIRRSRWTLRAVGGLTTAKSRMRFWCRNRPWLSGSAAPSRRSRAPVSIRFADCRHNRAQRLRSVLHVLYLIFNKVHEQCRSAFARADLSQEAIRLTRVRLQATGGRYGSRGILR